ncbi:hypothetical protein [Streptomyces guryensis]|uniref:Chromosome segregation ATPase n=1 Tax=Streptomyces guryensis TaxID=2886947 RepID=A0A9Q3VKP1_9ACTN|nr:hypothetical protein [Streptomyces guryensis]MCD9872796.1 hypothetical protein [Streptomyces guryensis]
MTIPTGPDSQLSTGIIGSRQLVAVQTFAIARLTSDPVALIPGTFIAVTGRGPKDSNESGKTSFLAAVALLLGDPEWQITSNGTANTVNLLFEPVIAGASTQLVDAADRGYIAGVFAESDGSRPHSVWLQISNDSPHVQVRHNPGVHLLTDGTDDERHRAAPAFYQQLGVEAVGSSEYANQLYGRSPKVLAYVASRGQVRSRPSLLKLEAGTYSPDHIGDALITLSGRSSLLEHDKGQRKALEDKRAKYAKALQRHEEALAREDTMLREAEARDELRRKIGSAVADRRAALARTLLDETARLRSAEVLLPQTAATLKTTTDLLGHLEAQKTAASNLTGLERARETAEQTKEQCLTDLTNAQTEERHLVEELTKAQKTLDEARNLSATHPGETAAALQEQLTLLAQQTAEAEINCGIAQRDARHYADQLRKAEQGQAGLVGEVLNALAAEEDIAGVGLLDQIDLDDQTRDRWEAALHPWRHAVCVAHSDLPIALKALAALPGAVLITEDPERTVTATSPTGDEIPWPEGIRSAPEPARGFLHALAAQTQWTQQPPHSSVGALGVHIVGSFPNPTVGRAALCAHLRARHDEALLSQQKAQNLLAHLARRITLTEAELKRALAFEALPQLLKDHREATDRLTHRRSTLPQVAALLEEAVDAWAMAKAALSGRKQRIEELERRIQETNVTLQNCDAERREQEAVIERHGADTAAADRGLDAEAARTLLNWPADWLPMQYTQLLTEAPLPPAAPHGEQPRERRSAAQLHMAANATVDGCMVALSLRAGTSGYPTVGLAHASRLDDADPGMKADAALQALSEWLTDNEAADADIYTTVEKVRAERLEENVFISRSVETLAEELRHTQEVITQRVAGALDNITTALDQLNRDAGLFGADLHYQIDPPTDTDHSWRCSVTPRWRRNPNGPMLAYDTVTNTAQEKLFSIHLVLAALLAAPHAQGRVLVLDELGDSLGQEHRREVLSAITKVATAHSITVLGTCQDTLMRDVAPVCGQILYFQYPSKSDYLNRPTRMFGYDAQAGRVELTAEQLTRRLAR